MAPVIQDLERMKLLIVRLLDINTSSIDKPVLDMYCTAGRNSSTAATTFHKIDGVMTRLQLSWSNCVGFPFDNTSAILLKPVKLLLKMRTCTLWDAHVISYTKQLINDE